MKRTICNCSLLIALIVFAGTYELCAQRANTNPELDTGTKITLHFRFDKSLLEKDYIKNAESLDRLNTLLSDSTTLASLDSVLITTASSPDGNDLYNIELARKRAKSIRGYIIWKHPNIEQKKIRAHAIGENWVQLRQFVAEDPEMPYRERALEIIDQPINANTKKWRLQQVGEGAAWRYIEQRFLRYLRAGVSDIVIYSQSAPIGEQPVIETPDSIQPAPEPIPEPIPVTEQPAEIALPASADSTIRIRRPLFAVKTNLLFDAASAVNIEIEVPIGKRWSIAGEWMFPWWHNSKSDLTMQLLAGHGEIKYWLGNRDRRDVLTGWSLGLYGGGGKYDFQIWNKNGVQGDLFDAGLIVGFAQKLSRSFRLEYAIGLGFMRANYEKYDKVSDTQYGDIKVVRYPWENHRQDWFGPTRAKISLVWLINYNRKQVVK